MAARPEVSRLREKLQKLSTIEGVLRTNLYDFLGEELRPRWHITQEDLPEIVLTKVFWQLERLISQLDRHEHRLAARYSYNLTGLETIERLDLVGRQKALGGRKEHPHPSDRTSRDYMNKEILPRFEASLSNQPAPHVPEDLLSAVAERAAGGERVTAIVRELLSKRPPPPPPRRSRLVPMVVGLALLVILVGGTGLVVWSTSNDGTTGDGRPNGPTAGIDPVQSPPGTSQPIADGEAVTETCGARAGCPVFNDPNTPSRSVQELEFMQEVSVSCRVYAPSMESVEWWYRLASEPYNNESYAPAVNFLNGDPVEGPYEHDVDEAVPEC